MFGEDYPGTALPGQGPVHLTNGILEGNQYDQLGVGLDSPLVGGAFNQEYDRYRIPESGEFDVRVGDQSNNIILNTEFIAAKLTEAHNKMGPILPIARIPPGARTVSFSVVEFTTGLLDKVPVKGVPRTLLHGVTSQIKTITRYGKLITGESGFAKTPFGQRILVLQIDQVIKSTISTIALAKVRALFQAHLDSVSKILYINGPLSEITMMDIWKREVSEFSSTTKRPGGLAKVINKYMGDFDSADKPNALLLPEGTSIWIKLATGDLPYARTGQKTPAVIGNINAISDLGSRLESNPNVQVFEVPPFIIGENSTWDAMDQYATIGTYAIMCERNRENNIIHYSPRKALTITIEDQRSNTLVEVGPDAPLAYCQLWDEAGLLDETNLEKYAGTMKKMRDASRRFDHGYGDDDDDNGGDGSNGEPPIHSFLTRSNIGDTGYTVTYVWGMTEDRQFSNSRMKLCVESMKMANKSLVDSAEKKFDHVKSLDGLLRSDFPDIWTTFNITQSLTLGTDNHWRLDLRALAKHMTPDMVPYGYSSWPGLLAMNDVPIARKGGHFSEMVNNARRYIEDLNGIVMNTCEDSLFLARHKWKGEVVASTHVSPIMKHSMEELLYQFYTLSDVHLLAYRYKMIKGNLNDDVLLKFSTYGGAIMSGFPAYTASDDESELVLNGYLGDLRGVVAAATVHLNAIRNAIPDDKLEVVLSNGDYLDPAPYGDLMYKYSNIISLLIHNQIVNRKYLFSDVGVKLFDMHVATVQAAIVTLLIKKAEDNGVAVPSNQLVSYYKLHPKGKGFWSILRDIKTTGEPDLASIIALFTTTVGGNTLNDFYKERWQGPVDGMISGANDTTINDALTARYNAVTQGKNMSIRTAINQVDLETVFTITEGLIDIYNLIDSNFFNNDILVNDTVLLPLLYPHGVDIKNVFAIFYSKKPTPSHSKDSRVNLYGTRTSSNVNGNNYGKKSDRQPHALESLFSYNTRADKKGAVRDNTGASIQRETPGNRGGFGFGSRIREQEMGDVDDTIVSSKLRSLRKQRFGADTTDLTRLFDMTNTQLQQPDGQFTTPATKVFSEDDITALKIIDHYHNNGIKKVQFGNLFNKNMRFRLKYADNIPNNITRVLFTLLCGCPITKEWFKKCLSRNFRFLGGFALFRMNQVHVTENAILTSTGPQVGRTLVGNPDIKQGQDALRKDFLANFTVNFAVVINRPKKVGVVSNVKVKRYLGGCDTTFARTPAEGRLESENGPIGSIIPVFLSDSECGRRMPDPIDAMGYFNPQHVDMKTSTHSPTNLQYINAGYYAYIHKWNHQDRDPKSLTGYVTEQKAARMNTVMFRDWQKDTVYTDVTTGKTEEKTTPSTGHRGPNRYTGYNDDLLGYAGYVKNVNTSIGTYNVNNLN